MGSQSIRKKGTKNSQNTTSDIKRQIDQDAARTALEPSFEVGHSPAGVMVPEFIRVSDKIDRSSQTVTAPFNTTTLNLWLKLNGNYIDYSNETNDVYAHVFQRNKAFMTGKFGTYAANLNWPSVVPPGDQIIIPASTPTALDFTTGFSYSCWIYPRTYDNIHNNNMILYKFVDSNNLVQLYYRASDTTVECQVVEAGVTEKRKKSGVNVNAWNHVALTYDGSAVEVYLNKVAGIASTAGGFSQTTTDLTIGNLGGNVIGDVAFRGGIDEFIYIKGQVLNQTNVNNLFDNNSF